MDWQGQKMVENLMQYLLLGSALVAFLTGYFTSSYSTMMYMYLAGMGVTLLVTVPNWPCFNRHPFHWLEPVYAGMASSRQVKSKEQAAARKAFVKPQGKRQRRALALNYTRKMAMEQALLRHACHTYGGFRLPADAQHTYTGSDQALLNTYLRTIVVNELSILRNTHVLLCALQFEYLQQCAKDMHRGNHNFLIFWCLVWFVVIIYWMWSENLIGCTFKYIMLISCA